MTVNAALAPQPLAILTAVCGIAVLREESEVVLLLYGIAVTGGASMIIGGALGVLGLACRRSCTFIQDFAFRGCLAEKYPRGVKPAATFWLQSAATK